VRIVEHPDVDADAGLAQHPRDRARRVREHRARVEGDAKAVRVTRRSEETPRLPEVPGRERDRRVESEDRRRDALRRGARASRGIDGEPPAIEREVYRLSDAGLSKRIGTRRAESRA